MGNKFKDKYKISSNRLSTWDYSSSGWYFVTICVKNRKCVLGKIVERKMVLSNLGEIVQKCWDEIPTHFDNVKIDEFIVMPNHIHGIIINYKKTIRTDGACPVSTTLGHVVGSFKSATTKYIHEIGFSFAWHPRFFDHVIRNETSLEKIREYIRFNPLKWNVDIENPINSIILPQT